MSSTEHSRVRLLAGALFDEAIAPLTQARRAGAAAEYFPRTFDHGLPSYFQRPILPAMQAADFEFPGGGTASGLVDALAAHWHAAGEVELAALATRLHELAAAVRQEACAPDGSVSIFCYTMF